MSKCPRSSCAFFMNRFFFCSFFQVSLALSDLFSNIWCIKKAFLGFSVDFFQQCVTTGLNANFFLHIFEYFNSIITPATTRGGTKFLPLIKNAVHPWKGKTFYWNLLDFSSVLLEHLKNCFITFTLFLINCQIFCQQVVRKNNVWFLFVRGSCRPLYLMTLPHNDFSKFS